MDRDKKIILGLLSTGHPVGNAMAASFGVQDLKGVVRELRADGYQIKTAFVLVRGQKSVRYGLLKGGNAQDAA
ncbi:hypothetical protein KAR29_02770 [Aminithiophilus ramosus]|uniref:Uncharacterized protein n=1 Tax=Aminithiophilus ramosus TaxID=3029084 RepID=A0A9Q7F064_9BACT|nr:hypothetical protein [Aminithiophilus ramosus]QTX32862.1 hypothetical protein KAR29_02770 [Aminithiophilus ramosus]